MMNMNKILALTASVASVADAIAIKPECIVQAGSTIGSVATGNTLFDESANIGLYDTESYPVFARVYAFNPSGFFTLNSFILSYSNPDGSTFSGSWYGPSSDDPITADW